MSAETAPDSGGSSPRTPIPHGKGRMTLAVIGLIVCVLAIGVSSGVVYLNWSARVSPENKSAEVDSMSRRLQKPAAPRTDYVGSAQCAECHSGIAESYRRHPMARSLAEVLPLDGVENYGADAEIRPIPSRRYRVEVADKQVLHHEVGLTDAGEEIYDQAVPVRYAVGSGRRGRSYLIDRDGLLFMSPLSWYSQNGRWDLSPDYAPEQHPRFERPAAERCLTCHAGRQNYAGLRSTAVSQRYREPPFAELSIGCERCHGPGGEHVRWRHAGDASAGRDPMLSLARLDPPRRDSACNQCHLQGVVQVLRYGRHHDDFRPGDHLGDIWSVFVSGTGVGASGATTAISQVEQMHASTCYQQSRGALGCISCHDPHSFPDSKTRPDYYRDRCLKCHARQDCDLPSAEQAAAPALGSCIACHMPKLSAEDVPHTTQTDHRIVRRAGKNKPVASRNENLKELKLFDEIYCPLSPLDLSRAQGLAVAGQAESRADMVLAAQATQLLAPLLDAAPDDVDVLDALATLAALQGDLERAAALWKRALEIEPERQETLYSLAIHFQNRENLRRAGDYLDRLLTVNPWHADAQRRRGFVHARLGEPRDSIRALSRGIEIDPSVPQAYLLLSEMQRLQGDDKAAQAAEARARSLGIRQTHLIDSPPK